MPLRADKSYKHEQLTEHVRCLAESLRPGDRLPSQNELMRQFDVSDRTVLRSLDDLRRAGLIIRRNGSGTYVADRDQNAPSTINRVSADLVAILAVPRSLPLFSALVDSVEANLRAAGRAALLVMDTDMDKRFQKAQELWTRGDVLGAIQFGTEIVPGLENAPFVTIGQTVGGRAGEVSLDNVEAGRLIGAHLWSLGHRRMATLLHEAAGGLSQISGVRLTGLRGFWEEQGAAWRPEWTTRHAASLLQGADALQAGLEALTRSFEPIFCGEGDTPTALFCINDEAAALAVRALERLGLSVPGDVSVVGFDDTGPLASHFQPALTTVRQPTALLGKLAVEMLLAQIADPGSAPASVRLPPEVTVRESTGPSHTH